MFFSRRVIWEKLVKFNNNNNNKRLLRGGPSSAQRARARNCGEFGVCVFLVRRVPRARFRQKRKKGVLNEQEGERDHSSSSSISVLCVFSLPPAHQAGRPPFTSTARIYVYADPAGPAAAAAAANLHRRACKKRARCFCARRIATDADDEGIESPYSSLKIRAHRHTANRRAHVLVGAWKILYNMYNIYSSAK